MFFAQIMICMTTLLCLVAAVPAALAVPKTSALDKRWSGGVGGRFWQHSASFIDFTRRQASDDTSGTCNLNNAKLPTAPIPLPNPSAGLYLSHVAVGRGTQNYTCDLANSTSIPVAAGAVAVLYNVSCVAADTPALLQRLPVVAINLPVPTTNDHASPAYNDLSGHHFFSDATTPVFDLNTALHQYGDGSFKKLNATAAPTDASPGQFSSGYGAVPWLKLGAKAPASQKMQEVYRVNTAGGNPPKTCVGQQATFTVEYSAEYWMYSK